MFPPFEGPPEASFEVSPLANRPCDSYELCYPSSQKMLLTLATSHERVYPLPSYRLQGMFILLLLEGGGGIELVL